jgi:hypothetical protein
MSGRCTSKGGSGSPAATPASIPRAVRSRPTSGRGDRDGIGNIRIRIPISRTSEIAAITIPLAQISSSGLLRAVTVQTGSTVKKAIGNPEILYLGQNHLHAIGVCMSGKHYTVSDGDDGLLLLAPPDLPAPIAVISILLAPTRGVRALALNEAA